jgi:16S rRNA G527 N7-methylase RsmG
MSGTTASSAQPVLGPGVLATDLPIRDAFVPRLEAAAAACGVTLPEGLALACATHFALLVRWNRTHNLTRIVDADDAALKHYLDCAVPLLVEGEPETGAGSTPPAMVPGAVPARVIDVGSGAGFPGLVAAMVWQATGWRGTPWAANAAGGPVVVPGVVPEMVPEIVLVEPARKRQSFLQVAARALGLSGVRVVSPPPPGSLTGALVMTRATFSGGLRQTLWPYVAPGGLLMAWTTPHELSMWHTEAGTWPGASATSVRHSLSGLDRRIARIRRAL